MKKILLSLGGLLAITSMSAFSQTNNFQGLSMGVTANSIVTSTRIGSNDALNNTSIGGDQTFIPSLELGYTNPLSENFTLGMFGTYDLAKNKAGSLAGAQFKSDNHYSLSLKPGYILSPTTMVYLTLGYHHMDGELASTSGSKGFNGIGYGAGADFLLDNRKYVRLEVQRINYNSNNIGSTNFDPRSMVGTIGIGMRF